MHQVSIPSISDPALNWKPIAECFPGPTKNWQTWLNDPGSLTARLIDFSSGNFSVNLVSECWETYFSTYLVSVLGSRYAAQRMWSRKVVLCGHQRPWVTAHTLVPQESLNSPLSRIKNLRSKPLGAFLFSHAALQRIQLDIVRWDKGWGRCSLFVLFDKPILVAEFFNPELIAAP